MSSKPEFTVGVTLACQCKDIKATIRWYEEVLGLSLLYHAEEIGWCEIASPTKDVSIGYSQVESPKVGAGPVPVFNVPDIAAARAAMEARKVKFDGATREIPGLVKLATYFDPDGNAFMLSQSLSNQ